MAKKKPASRAAQPAESAAMPATLKDLLPAHMIDKLKSQANDMKAEQERIREQERLRAEEARKAEQKRNENDMEYLLNNSKMVGNKYN